MIMGPINQFDALKSPGGNQAEREVVESPKPASVEPRSKDVIFGRGKPYMRHPGNLALHEITDKYRGLYKEFRCGSVGVVKRKQEHGFGSKQEIAEKVIELVLNTGARFLRRDEERDVWVQVDLVEARTKVAHILRGKDRKGSASAEAVDVNGPSPLLQNPPRIKKRKAKAKAAAKLSKEATTSADSSSPSLMMMQPMNLQQPAYLGSARSAAIARMDSSMMAQQQQPMAVLSQQERFGVPLYASQQQMAGLSQGFHHPNHSNNTQRHHADVLDMSSRLTSDRALVQQRMHLLQSAALMDERAYLELLERQRFLRQLAFPDANNMDGGGNPDRPM